jgi:hypothetical protein
MTGAGWVFFSVFWGAIIVLNVYCYSKILRNKHKHGQE